MNYSDIHDIGSRLKSFSLLDNTRTVNAAATTLVDSTSNGIVFDRRAATAGGLTDLYHSVKILVPFNHTSGVGSTVGSLTWNLQDSLTSASTGFADYDDIDNTTGQSIAMTSGSHSGIDEADFRLDNARRFIRVQTAVILSGTTVPTNFVDFSVVGVFGPGDQPPAD